MQTNKTTNTQPAKQGTTRTIQVFTYDELSPEAQEKARDWYREGSVGDDWTYEPVYEDAGEIAKLLGITLDERNGKPAIFWSGFSSQGDGACFEGSWAASDVKPGEVAQYAPQDKELHRIAGIFEGIAKDYPEATFSVRHVGHYHHKHSTSFDVAMDNGDGYPVSISPEGEVAFGADLVEVARDFMQWLYDQLEKAYEYSVSDEAVTENIIANEYHFTEDGARSVTL